MSTSSQAQESHPMAGDMPPTYTQAVGLIADEGEDFSSIPSLTLPPLVLPTSNKGELKSVHSFEELWTQIDKQIPQADAEDLLNFIQDRLVRAYSHNPDSETSGLAIDMVSMIMQEVNYLKDDILKAVELRKEMADLAEQVTEDKQRMESLERHKRLAQASIARLRKTNAQQSNEIAELKKTIEEQDARLKRLNEARKAEVIRHVREVAELKGQEVVASVFQTTDSDKGKEDPWMLDRRSESLSIGDHPFDI